MRWEGIALNPNFLFISVKVLGEGCTHSTCCDRKRTERSVLGGHWLLHVRSHLELQGVAEHLATVCQALGSTLAPPEKKPSFSVA
jgi:hypothetical protein